MQADCYLCLSEANRKITRVAVHLQSCHTDIPSAATGTTLKDNICQSTLLNSKVSAVLNRSHLLWEDRILACMPRGLLIRSRTAENLKLKVSYIFSFSSLPC